MPKDDAINWMWTEACAMLARAERLHSQFFHIGASGARQRVWEPPVDVLETKGHVVVLVGLPGVDPETVRASRREGSLIVIGQRTLPRELGRIFIHRMELPLGRFEREVILPRGQYGDVEYTTKDGCLIITLTKVF